jgi:hypothetical protein
MLNNYKQLEDIKKREREEESQQSDMLGEDEAGG